MNQSEEPTVVIEDTTIIICNDTLGASYVQINAQSLDTVELARLLELIGRAPGVSVISWNQWFIS